MKLNWLIEQDDVQRVKMLIHERRNDAFVQKRIQRNLAPIKPKVVRNDFWKQLVICLLTTQTRAGPDSSLTQFVKKEPFSLSYDDCLAQAHVGENTATVLQKFRATRFPNRVAEFIAENLKNLEEGLWDDLMNALEHLRLHQDVVTERKTANLIDDNLPGFGPKQSRNLLQCLGLTRFEIPIDSRIANWLNKFGFPLQLSPVLLGDRSYYCVVLDAIQKLCAACDIMPCILDAAIFSSTDGDKWTEETVIGIF